MKGDPEVYVPKTELKHGVYYRGTCRNANVARWNAEENQFYHWRWKFNFHYVETIKCPEDDEIYDVFYAFEELLNPEEEIPFKVG